MCVRALDTACWGKGGFARVSRLFSIFLTTKICLLYSRGPCMAGAVGQHPTDLPVNVTKGLILPA